MVGEVESLPVSVVAEPGIMIKTLSTFHTGVEEVALVAHSRLQVSGEPTVELRSYLDPNKSENSFCQQINDD